MPAAVVTVTLRAPSVARGGNGQRGGDLGGATTTTLLTVTPVEETVTVAPETKFVPVRVTGTWSPWTPLVGAMAVRVGAAALTVKMTAAVVPAVW